MYGAYVWLMCCENLYCANDKLACIVICMISKTFVQFQITYSNASSCAVYQNGQACVQASMLQPQIEIEKLKKGHFGVVFHRIVHVIALLQRVHALIGNVYVMLIFITFEMTFWLFEWNQVMAVVFLVTSFVIVYTGTYTCCSCIPILRCFQATNSVKIVRKIYQFRWNYKQSLNCSQCHCYSPKYVMSVAATETVVGFLFGWIVSTYAANYQNYSHTVNYVFLFQ